MDIDDPEGCAEAEETMSMADLRGPRSRLARDSSHLRRAAAILLLTLTACAHQPANGDVEAIRSARVEQNRAIAAGDAARAAEFWTDDVTLRRGLGAAVTGREAYMKLVAEPAGLTYERTPEEIDVSPHWPLAFESGTWIARAKGEEVIRGRYSAQWVKRDGRWLIRSEVFVALTCKSTGCDAVAQY